MTPSAAAMPPTPSPLGARLRTARIRAGLGVNELATRTARDQSPNASATPASAISALENGGQESIDGRKLVTLARALGVTAEWLVMGDG